MIITVCGSTRFKDAIQLACKELTLAGHIVLAPMVFHHDGDEEVTLEQKIRLDNLHKQKINMSDAIYVVNIDGYIGESTYGEIDWAHRMGKEILFLVPPEELKEKPPIEEPAHKIETKDEPVLSAEAMNDKG